MSSEEQFLLLEHEDALSPREKELRDRFVEQYFVDNDALAASIRIGYPKHIAHVYAQQFMGEPYVRRKIAEREVAKAPDPKTEEAETKRLIRSRLLAEANYNGPGSSHSARVAALTKLMSLYGMDAPTKTQTEVTNRGGVMRIPTPTSMDTWENVAVKDQEDLVRRARDLN